MQGIYPTYVDALNRVEYLRSRGIWPGIVSLRDGSYDLKYNPRGI